MSQAPVLTTNRTFFRYGGAGKSSKPAEKFESFMISFMSADEIVVEPSSPRALATAIGAPTCGTQTATTRFIFLNHFALLYFPLSSTSLQTNPPIESATRDPSVAGFGA